MQSAAVLQRRAGAIPSLAQRQCAGSSSTLRLTGGSNRQRLRSSRKRLQVVSASSDFDADAIMAKYGGAAASSNGNKPAVPKPKAKSQPGALGRVPITGNGTFVLLLLNVLFFVADHVLHLPWMQLLYLNHLHPRWWQWLTHAFCHASFEHLSGNLFLLCTFGKLVEEGEGASGLIFTYAVTAIGAALASVFTQPAVTHGAVAVSVGASGAIFGLFAVSVLTRMTRDPRRLLEGAILGQFVMKQVWQEVRSQASGGLSIAGVQVGHIAHLGGALAGVLLVLLLHRIPEPVDG